MNLVIFIVTSMLLLIYTIANYNFKTGKSHLQLSFMYGSLI